MNLLILKTLLIKKGKDDGFTLPIVLAIGLVMFLLSTVSLLQAGDENTNAIIQSQASDALAAAEIGVARYRDLLLNNRVLAVNSLPRWTDTTAAGEPVLNDQTCEHISTATDTAAGNMGWADITGDDAWKDITVDGDIVGQYRLVSYEYDRNGVLGDFDATTGVPTNPTQDNFSQLADDGDENNNGVYDADEDVYDAALNNHNDWDNDAESDARGILVVQGRDNSGSEAQLQVTMPVGVNTQEINTLNPALWIATDTPTRLRGDNVDVNGGNIVLKRAGTAGAVTGCNTALPANTFTDPVTGITSTQNVIGEPRDLPELFDISAAGLTIRDLNGTNITANSGAEVNFYNPSSTADPLHNTNNSNEDEIVLATFFDSVDADEDGVVDPVPSTTLAQNAGDDGILDTLDDLYVYRFGGPGAGTGLTINAGDRIESDGDRRTILYINGDLNINTIAGQETQLVNSQHDSIGISQIARYFEIHVNGDVNIDGTGDVKITGLLRVNGEVDINADVNNVEILGSVWANDFDDRGANSISITPDDVEFFSITEDRIPAPLTYRPSSWETQEVTP